MVTRRQLILGGIAFTLTALNPLGVVTGWGAPSKRRKLGRAPIVPKYRKGYVRRLNRLSLFPGVPLDQTKEKAVAMLNTQFTVWYDSAYVLPLKLVSVEDESIKGNLHQFVLSFNTRWQHDLLTADTYTIEHAELGLFKLYITPVSQDSSGTSYQAIINHVMNIPN